MKKPIHIDDRLEIIGNLVVRARIFFEIWWFYEGAETRPQILETMNEYPEFFRYDSHAHFTSYVIHMAALYEKRQDTINLPSLTTELHSVDPNYVENHVTPLFLLTDSVAKKIFILRSSLFAHRSRSLTYATAFDTASVSADEMRDFTATSLQIVNHLRFIKHLPEKIFTPLPQSHIAKILKALHQLSHNNRLNP